VRAVGFSAVAEANRIGVDQIEIAVFSDKIGKFRKNNSAADRGKIKLLGLWLRQNQITRLVVATVTVSLRLDSATFSSDTWMKVFCRVSLAFFTPCSTHP
jgi:hypothetical protein